MRTRDLWLLLAVTACGPKLSADECQKQATAVSAYLAAMDHGPPLYVPSPVALVQRTDLASAAIPAGPLVTVGAQIEVGGKAVTHLRAALADAPTVVLLVDQTAAWETVQSVLAAARDASVQRIAFVFAQPAPPPPPHTAIDDELDKAMADAAPDYRAAALAKYASKKIEPCAALGKLFGTVSPSTDDKAAMIIRGVAPALIDCKCAVAPADVQSLLARILYDPHPLGAIVVRVDATAKHLDAAPGAVWRDVQQQLAPSTAALGL